MCIMVINVRGELLNVDIPIYSGAESTLKVGVYFNIFPNFLAITESGGVTKSQPIDPFFDVIYLFLNVRLGQKVFKFTHFWAPSSTL